MNSDAILKLLRAKHSEDVFVPECKDGPTQGVRTFAQMDAWVMPRSWSHPHLTGYEIKVSRSDFIGDEKWRKYLPCCNYLYFVAPPGVILAGELAPELGYYEVSKTGGRLFLRKKAQYRQIEEPASLFRYVLMSRASIGTEGRNNGRLTFWKNWMDEKQVDHLFGHNVSRAIAKRVSEEIDAVKCRNHELSKLMEGYDEIRATLKDLGLSEHCSDWQFQNKMWEVREGVTPRDIRQFEDVIAGLTTIVEKLKPKKVV